MKDTELNTDRAREYFNEQYPPGRIFYESGKPEMFLEQILKFAESYHQHRIKEVMPSDKWIAVNEEYPEDQRLVLLRDCYDNYSTGYLHGQESGWITYNPNISLITHWCDIEGVNSSTTRSDQD